MEEGVSMLQNRLQEMSSMSACDSEIAFDATPQQTLQVGAQRRAALLGQRPVVVWLTGLSGAGKSTIADQVDLRLHDLGFSTVVLDGDNLRRGLNGDLGFTDGDRSENVRRVAHVADMMADAGLIVIVSLISPYRRDRDEARRIVGAVRFLEVFVDASIETCARRDPKGLYARARSGALRLFTGIGSDYERPLAPDLHIPSDRLDAPSSARLLLQTLLDGRLALPASDAATQAPSGRAP
ncbi:adenylyl-sulfate kinase [Aureimonas sp. AU40]|uniref:adenylyl-sulfate kinase n=1 Tax=Aureimonas sp. AU40 TaxID=1637747 RepID=UPI001FCE09D7|nr:adenylyl-sulfate kinase [Aureimonas sp. AU40]